MSSQRGRGFANTLTRKCWVVKKRKAFFLAPQACAPRRAHHSPLKRSCALYLSSAFRLAPPSAADLAEAFHNLPNGLWREDFNLRFFRDSCLIPYENKYVNERIKSYAAAV